MFIEHSKLHINFMKVLCRPVCYILHLIVSKLHFISGQNQVAQFWVGIDPPAKM